MFKQLHRKLLALLAALLLVGTLSGPAFASGAEVHSSTTAEAPSQSQSTVPNNGPCDPKKKKYPVGMITVFESPIVSSIDQVKALEASVKAFNKRGGVGGHCMALTTCDDKADPNIEADCARQFVDKGIVATLNDQTSFNPQAVIDLFEKAGLPRVGVQPGLQELGSTVTYATGGGATGGGFVDVSGCGAEGKKKIAVITLDVPGIDALFEAQAPAMKAYGAELVAKIFVPAGTTDFQQFTLAAENAGADCAIIGLGSAEAVQVLQAAEQLGSKMAFSASLGTFSKADVAKLGTVGKNLILNSEVPPITGDQKQWPILKTAIADLEKSGEKALQAENMRDISFRSWLATYAFTKIIEQYGDPNDVTREGVTKAMHAAKDVDMFGLIPPWTPTASVLPNSPFKAVSQPYYYIMTWNGKKFVLNKKRVNFIEELQGNLDYPQPGQSTTSSSSTTTATTGG